MHFSDVSMHSMQFAISVATHSLFSNLQVPASHNIEQLVFSTDKTFSPEHL